MVNAGASIEAFLKLDASGFNKGIESATTNVTKFKESMLDIGKETNTFNSGVNSLSKALDALVRKMSLLDTVDTKAVNNFKTMASALLDVATAAQRLSVDSMRGQAGIQALNTIMEVFNTGVSSAEIVVTNLSASITNMVSTTVADMEKFKVSFESAQESLMALGRGVLAFNRIDSESNKVKESVRMMDTEFKRAKEDLLTLGQGIPSFNRIDAESNKVKESVRLMDAEFKRAKADLLAIGQGVPAFNRINAESNKVKESIRMMDAEFKKAKEDLLTLGQGVSSFNRINAESNKVKESVRMMDNEFQKAKADLLAIGQGALAFNRIETGTQQAKRELQLYEAELQKSSAKAQAMWNQNTASINKTTSATQRATTATNRLTKAFSSLRMMGTMVGSMMVWNFAHNLITATRETVNAKSEMEGYFKMLHFNQAEIGNFNKALDNTVSQFQRINKYALGETISSIGVEFNLSTKEMEKAMPVVSMITSEYLRAGRNVNEASLAVKDILQGEFQRLSRETGVKGDQLKEAGWSGDKNDVMGLLEALEKVGKSRNWDVFVTKANSLNDAVLILQNRFSEWTAEMVNVVQPSILAVFNTLMSVGGLFGNVFSGIWQWLNGDGIASQIVKWTGLATAIGSVVTALIHYRTGANLVQIVQMGLRGTITATVLGLKAEEVATYGTRNAIAAKITSLKAEQVSLMGVRNALLTKALGLKAETVATLGLKGAIMEEVLGRRLQKAEIQGASVYQKMAIVNEYQEQIAKRGTLASIIAKVAGVNMETFAEKGLIVALAERIATTPLYVGSLKAEEVAELSTAEAAWILVGSITPLIAIFAAVAIAVYGLIKPLQDASAEMKAFNTLNKDGDNIIKEHKKTMDSYTNSVNALTQKRDKYAEGTKRWKRANDELVATQKDLDTATKNYHNSIKAVEMTRSRQEKFEKRRDEIMIHNQTRLADAYIKAGLSSKEASEMASKELREAERGAEQLRHALQMIKLEADKGAKKQEDTIGMLKNYGLDNESIKKYGNNLADANAKVMEGMEKFMTSEDLMDRLGGWLEIQQGRLEEWWTEFNAFFEVRDWDAMRDKLLEGIKYVLTGLGAFDWISGLKESIDKKGIWGTLMEWLWGEGDSDGVLDIIWQWADSMILEPLAQWINWFMEDPVSHFYQIEDDLASAIGKFLFGKDSKPINDIVWDWVDRTITQPLLYHINHLPEYILNWVGSTTFDWAKSLFEMVFGEDSWSEDLTYEKFKNEILPKVWDGISKAISDFFSGSGDGGGSGLSFKTIDISGLLKGLFSLGDYIDFTWITDTLNNSIIVPIQTWIENFNLGSLGIELPKIDILGLIKNLIPTTDEGGIDIGGWLNSLFNIDGIVSYFTTNLTTIVTTATTIASSVGTIFSNLKSTVQTHITNLVNNVSTGFENAKSYATSKITAMRDSVSNVIHQMTDAWTKMKDSILNSAKLIYDGVKSKFDSVKDTLKDFFTKLQNPSQWGAGERSYSRSPRPQTAKKIMSSSIGSALTGAGSPKTRGANRSGAGINPYSSPKQKVKLSDLYGMIDGDNKVTLSDFLAMFTEGGFGGWDFHEPTKKKVFDTGKSWKSGSPVIQGIGSIDGGYEVRRFWDGKPSFTFSEFQQVAEAIFSRIPYKFYYDSEWKGSWLGALLSGALNCSDGAEALIALASVFGFSGYKQHTTTKSGIGHFFAVINGQAMDTTHFQNSGSWSPLGGAGIPTRTANPSAGAYPQGSKTVNVNVEISGTVYGVDDLDSKIQESVKQGLREEFNDPYTVAI